MYEQDKSSEGELEGTLDEEFSNINNTNRETRLKEIEENNRDKHFHIEKLEIQGQIITFNSSSAIQAYEDNIEAIMYLQHFTEKGLIPSEWDGKKVNNLIISQHMQSDDEAELIIDTSKEMDIRLSISPDTKEITIGHIFKIDFGEQNTKINYYDKDLDREEYFYINEIYSFDPYEYIKTSVEKIEDAETRKEVFNNLTQAAKRVYPRDKNLAVIKYETKNDIQLNFYMKEFLDRDLNDISSAGSLDLCGSLKKKV